MVQEFLQVKTKSVVLDNLEHLDLLWAARTFRGAVAVTSQ